MSVRFVPHVVAPSAGSVSSWTRVPVDERAAARGRVLVLVSLAVLAGSGCVRIEERIKLTGTGAGSVQVEVTFPQFGLRWLPGKPAENWIRPHLPAGVKLTSFRDCAAKLPYTDADGKQHEVAALQYGVDLSFNDVRALSRLRIGPDTRNMLAAGSGAAPGMRGPDDVSRGGAPDSGPFQRITLKREGGLLRFERVLQAARSMQAREGGFSTGGGGSPPQAADLSGGEIVVSIECPGEVVEHNAQQIQGRTLTWKFALTDLQRQQDRDWTLKFTCRTEGE